MNHFDITWLSLHQTKYTEVAGSIPIACDFSYFCNFHLLFYDFDDEDPRSR